jgi:long-chain acyl-CoA synthetase
VIIYTSGTTGRSKGAELTHNNLFLNAQSSIAKGQYQFMTEEDVLLAVIPLFHATCQTCIQNAAICGGAQIVMMDRFKPLEVLEAMQNNKVTIFIGVPTLYFELLRVPERKQFDTSSLRICTSGGAAMPVEVMKKFEKEFGGAILEGYGLTETSPVATYNMSIELRKPGSIGLPLEGVEIKIVDNNGNEVPTGEKGELIIRGYNVMKGYYNKPEETEKVLKNGWLHTGDIGKTDEDGYFYIVDRKKDMIIRGGANIYPRQVEEVLYCIDGVTEAAVIGVPDEKYGEEVKAFLALKPGTKLTADEVIEYCKSRLATFKCPKSVEFRDSLPKGNTGKILKRVLKK